VLSKVLGSVNPDVLHRVLSGVPEALAQKPEEEPPSLFAIFRRMTSKESRRAQAAIVTLLDSVGRGLGG